MKKRMVVLIALLTALSLFLEGCAQADTASAGNPPESTDVEAETWELDDFFDNQEEQYNENPDSYMAEAYDPDEQEEECEPEELDEVFLHLDGMPIVAMAPFVDGVGWIQYMENGELYTAAVETDGHVLFEIPGPVWYASPFENGAAFVVISDNPTYYPNADPTIGCYEQVAPAETHEEIYDLSGNLLFSTLPLYAPFGAGESHILCAGDDMFVVLRHVTGVESDSWQLGTISKYGDLLYDFVEYENINKSILPTWKGKYHGTGRLPNMYGAGYGNGNDGDQGDGFSRYVGEGVYYLTSGSAEVFYKPETELVVESSGEKLLSDCYGGKVLSSWRGNYYIQDINGESYDKAIPLQSNMYYEDIQPGRIFRYDHFMTSNLYYHDHAYYDIEMNRAIEIEEYTSLQMDGSVFNEGFALIFLVGKDGNTYVTVIDDEGTIQFEPIRAQRTSGKVSDGYFVVRTDTECAVYDITGDYVRHLCSAAEGEYFRDISGGYVTIFGVVNGKGMNRIYDMNPEWTR